TAGPAEAQGTAIEVSRSVKNDASPRLDSLPVLPPQGTPRPPRRVSPASDRPAPAALRPDPLRQAAPPTGRMPAPSVNLDGIANGSPITPPDIIGAVGPNHYVQMTNLGFAI